MDVLGRVPQRNRTLCVCVCDVYTYVCMSEGGERETDFLFSEIGSHDLGGLASPKFSGQTSRLEVPVGVDPVVLSP